MRNDLFFYIKISVLAGLLAFSPLLLVARGNFYLGIVGGGGLVSPGQAQAIAFSPREINFTPNDKASLTAIAGLTAGYQFPLPKDFLLQTGLSGYYFTGSNNQGVANEGFNSANYHYAIKSDVLVTDIAVIYQAWQLSPFVRLSLGYGMNQASTFQAESLSDSTLTFANGTHSNLVYGAGMGVMLGLSSSFVVGLEYAYWHLGETQLGIGGTHTGQLNGAGQTQGDGLSSQRSVNAIMLTILYQLK